MGTGRGIAEHGTDPRELGHLVGCGLTPMGALRAGTAEAAEVLSPRRRSRPDTPVEESGRIRSGSSAAGVQSTSVSPREASPQSVWKLPSRSVRR